MGNVPAWRFAGLSIVQRGQMNEIDHLEQFLKTNLEKLHSRIPGF
jgi:hypothetical protein